MSKPKVVFWIGNRTRDLLINDEDVLSLEAIAEVNWARAERDMSDESVCDNSRNAVAVISSWGAPIYSADILDGCPDLSMFVRIGGSLKGVIDTSALGQGDFRYPVMSTPRGFWWLI